MTGLFFQQLLKHIPFPVTYHPIYVSNAKETLGGGRDCLSSSSYRLSFVFATFLLSPEAVIWMTLRTFICESKEVEGSSRHPVFLVGLGVKWCLLIKLTLLTKYRTPTLPRIGFAAEWVVNETFFKEIFGDFSIYLVAAILSRLCNCSNYGNGAIVSPNTRQCFGKIPGPCVRGLQNIINRD